MLLPATWTIPTAAATTETHLLSSCYRGMSTAATAPSLLYPTCSSSSSSSSHDIVTSPLKSPLTSSNNHYQQQPQPHQPHQPHQQYKSKSTTENEVITDTVPTRENMRHRVRFNPNHQCLLIDLTRLRVQQVEHVENIRSSIENVLVSNKAHNIHCLVNYDAFIIENDSLIEAYAKRVVKYISEQYYKSIQRYTTSHECHACILKLERMLEDLNVKLSKVYLGAEIIGDRYIVEECIGEGSFGRVKVAYDKITGEKVAVKELKLEQVRKLGIEDFVEREHEIMKQISSAPDAHENIVKWYDYIEEDDVIHIVLEYCANGPLERPDEEHEQFSEQKAHDYFVQIISALDYLHTRHHVMHRDLQLCNICTTDKDVVKIVDFGVADYFVPNEQKHTLFAGNVNYVPPEMTLTKRYVGPEIDTWSAGVCLYKMVTGYLPFRRVSDILIGKFSIPLEEEHDLSEECKDLIRHILNPDASKRYTIPMIKEHPWFKATTV